MKHWILGLFICLAAVLLVGCKFNIGDYYPVTPINNDPVRNVPDVDVPQYSLSIVGGKVVADVDYVVNIDIGDKEEFRILNLADVQLSETDVRTNSEDYRFFLETTGRLIAQTHPDLITLTGDQTSNGDPDVVRAVGVGQQGDAAGCPASGSWEEPRRGLSVRYRPGDCRSE